MPNDFAVTLSDWSGLLALVLGSLHEPDHVFDQVKGKTVCTGNLLGAFVTFDVGLEDGIEHLVRRQRVGIPLVRAEFRRGRLLDDGHGDDFALPVGASGRRRKRGS